LNVLDLYAALKRHWGYDSFRPLQERIIQSLLGGSDVAVVMPTGGGKSLCYQLPALVLGKTVIVISPLIALMQDQVAQLADMGIPAAVLNSTQPLEEQRAVMRAAAQGAFRLIYLSPERLARADTISWLRQVPVMCFAIDEAHCISEWGHEFRPEYRQLSALRHEFPDKPIAAFTASATQRVRHDILQQLQLRDPHRYIASFHRANLRYVVRECDSKGHARLLLAALRAYHGESVIVYAPTITSVEDTVDRLASRRIAAVPYHGQMDTATRRRNQELWMNDEVRVLVGTIAFGLGINKPAVRAVIHTSLPKSVEQYYQEAGRAGRDGDPADCVLLWQPKDAGLLAYFIGKLSDFTERERAWQRYHTIRRFAESTRCRHLQICHHFGQVPKWLRCGMCDICGNLPEWLAVPAGDLREQAPQIAAPKKERIREVMPVSNSRPSSTAQDLVDYFKQWRRQTAERTGVPAYVVLSDAALEDLCRKRPANLRELLAVAGIGERKAELYGAEIFARFEAFERGARAAKRETRTVSPSEETIHLLAEGKSFNEIAEIRVRQPATVVNMVADLVEKGRVAYRTEWVGEENHQRIMEAIGRLGSDRLKPLREALSEEITYEQIRLVVAYARIARIS
jgi:ATP-dependent DNA helicase RecQ